MKDCELAVEIIQVDNLLKSFSYKGWDFNNLPMVIYSKWIQRIGMFVIPVFAIFNLPPMFLLKQLNTVYWIWIFAAPVLFMFLTRKFWSFAVKHYSSASS